jgi:hypothetical protein
MAEFEKATERRAKRSRRIKLPGKTAEFSEKDPVEIARELRAKSELGRREARLKAAEAKLGR